MSAESFLNAYIGHNDVPQIIENWRSEAGGKSAPRVVAEKLMKEAGYELRLIRDRSLDRHTNVVSAADTPAYKFDVAAVLFGISVVSIETALSTSVFEPATVSEMFYASTRGAYNYGTTGSLEPEYINYGDWRQMIYEADADKKLSLFFEEESRMPKRLMEILKADSMGSLAVIRSRIIPTYNQMLSPTLGGPTPT